MVGAVVRVPVAAVHAQQLRPRLLLHDRHAHSRRTTSFTEYWPFRPMRRPALACAQDTEKNCRVDEVELLGAVLEAERDADAVLRPEAASSRRRRRGRTSLCMPRCSAASAAALESRRLQVVERRLRDASASGRCRTARSSGRCRRPPTRTRARRRRPVTTYQARREARDREVVQVGSAGRRPCPICHQTS